MLSRYLPKRGGISPFPWLWLGTWSLGGEGFGPSDARVSRAVLEKALEAGIRHIDTAGLYAQGKSEALVAKVLARNREEIFVSTKGGLLWEGNDVLHRGSPEDLRRSLVESLERLKTNYVDLFQLHWPDPRIPLTESLDALREFQKEGLIRSYGVGNLTVREITQYIEPDLFLPHQVHFNPIHPSQDILEAGHHRNRCFNCVVSPLEQGLLAHGRGSLGLKALGKRDLRRRNPQFHSEAVSSWLSAYQELTLRCPLPRVSLILLWILAHEEVDVVIPGPRTPEQLDEVLDHSARIRSLSLGLAEGERFSHWAAILRDTIGEKLWALLCEGPYYTLAEVHPSLSPLRQTQGRL